RTALRLLAIEGRHWMLTPRRELTLVHAVQRPLWAPKVVPPSPAEPGDKASAAPDGFYAQREIGQTHAALSADVDLSVRSTGQIDIDASWTEFVDDLEHPRPDTLQTAGRVSTLRVPAWMPDGVNALPFHDTPRPKDQIARRTWIAAPVHHEFGDTKHREVTYTLTAGTRFREYFPPAITGDPANITQSGASCVAHVPSSARPAAPLPRYAIPTFGWTRTGVQPGWTSARSVRSGGGVRVWMDRPWFSSGAQERLGIVLHPGSKAVSDRLRPLVSQYGRDPIWNTEKPAHFLGVGDFAGHIAEEAVPAGLTLDEGANNVGVVSYKVAFDEQRRLWYADVRLPGKAVASYTPFVRLATARLQPWSLLDVELSRVALLDFLQLVPTRTLELRRSGDRVQLSLTGVAPDGPLTNEVHVTVEIHDGKIPGNMGWRAVAGHEAVELHEGVSNPAHFLGAAQVDTALHTPELLRRLAFRAAPAVAEAASISDADVHAMISAEEVTRLLPEFGDRFGAAIIEPIPLIVLPGHRTWSGAIGLPAVRGAQRLRLVVREVEVLRSDREAVGSSDPENVSPPARRIVYLETIEL
ncbi:MAG: hypothetical protein H0W96_10595, partial [Solirubrobacterales bacterium]|nr:hypothetical protein [Solirubrobacterales bacterium]